MSIAEYAEKLKSDPRFLDMIARYWLQELRITASVDFQNTSVPGGITTISRLFPGRNSFSTNNRSLGLRGSTWTLMCAGITAGATEDQKAFYRSKCCGYTNSTNPADPLVPVRPWWNPDATVNVCPGVVQNDHCGAQLQNCFPNDARTLAGVGLSANLSDDYYLSNIRGGFTAEPGYLIARVIRDNLPWDEVVKGRFSMANGSMQHFLKTDFAQAIVTASVPGSWRNGQNVVELANATNPQDGRWYPVDHFESGAHAGVISTMAFQKTFNGHYAKANAAMESFLCKKFQAPDSAVIPQTHETEPAKKPYCNTCHSTLDPLAQHFTRWPSIGSTNFFYNASSGISSSGSFMGYTDSDTSGLGKTFAKLEEFKTCAISHAFRFLTGREMTGGESAEYMKTFLTKYNENNRSIWPVMLEIIQSEAFEGKEQ